MREINIIIISGLSGSGKSTALRTLEDLGFYCVDNLPVLLLLTFIKLCQSSSDDISKVALGIDIRERSFLKEYAPELERLRAQGYNVEMIFLECSDDVLLRRFSETRRQHPLSAGGSVLEGIRRERQMLDEMRTWADSTIDTSVLNVHQLRTVFQEYFEKFSKHDMALTFLSFGFKYGIPHDSDIVMDVRFLPNPFFVRELKELNGKDQRVVDYIFKWKETKTFVKKLQDLLSFQIPLFEREGKAYLTVAIGCTGGKHRSIAIAGYLKNMYEQQRRGVRLIHRDIEKDSISAG